MKILIDDEKKYFCFRQNIPVMVCKLEEQVNYCICTGERELTELETYPMMNSWFFILSKTKKENLKTIRNIHHQGDIILMSRV